VLHLSVKVKVHKDVLRERKRDCIDINFSQYIFMTVLLLIIIVNLFLCLIYELNFILVCVRKKHGMCIQGLVLTVVSGIFESLVHSYSHG
jgi:hypothetical protein